MGLGAKLSAKKWSEWLRDAKLLPLGLKGVRLCDVLIKEETTLYPKGSLGETLKLLDSHSQQDSNALTTVREQLGYDPVTGKPPSNTNHMAAANKAPFEKDTNYSDFRSLDSATKGALVKGGGSSGIPLISSLSAILRGAWSEGCSVSATGLVALQIASHGKVIPDTLAKTKAGHIVCDPEALELGRKGRDIWVVDTVLYAKTVVIQNNYSAELEAAANAGDLANLGVQLTSHGRGVYILTPNCDDQTGKVIEDRIPVAVGLQRFLISPEGRLVQQRHKLTRAKVQGSFLGGDTAPPDGGNLSTEGQEKPQELQEQTREDPWKHLSNASGGGKDDELVAFEFAS